MSGTDCHNVHDNKTYALLEKILKALSDMNKTLVSIEKELKK
jgi:hypothetical protein